MMDSMSSTFRSLGGSSEDFFTFTEVFESYASDLKQAQLENEALIDMYLFDLEEKEDAQHERVMCLICCAVYDVKAIHTACVDPTTFKCDCGCSRLLPMAND